MSWSRQGSDSVVFDVARNEIYEYDNSLDYVTAHYGDTLAGADKTFGYNAAGNRTKEGKLVDKLNRATASQDGARGSDVLGNSTMITYSGNVQRTFDWDCLNRLLDKKASGVVQASYNYRADGMRVGKYVASGNKTTVYRYDGQMGMEDVETSPGTSTVPITRSGSEALMESETSQAGFVSVLGSSVEVETDEGQKRPWNYRSPWSPEDCSDC